MLHNTTLRFAYMDFFQHYLGYLVFGESVFINRFISDIWLFWLYGSLGRTKHVAHISGTQCILNRDIFGSGSVTNSFYSWSYPVGVWQQGGPTWNLSAGLLKCFYSVTASSSKRGSSEWTGPPSRTAKKVRSAKVIFPTGWAIPTISGQNSVLTLEGMSRALWRSMVWASSRRFGDSEFWNYHCEREWISAKPDINFFFPPRNWMQQQRKNAIDDDGEVVKLDRKMAVTLNWMALWRPDLVLLIEGFDFPFKKVVVISELGKIT